MDVRFIKDIPTEYLEFLDDEGTGGKYCERVNEMIKKEQRRLVININDLRRKKPKRAASLLEDAYDELAAFQKATKEYVESINPSYAKKNDEFYLGFEGSFGKKHFTPRQLTSQYLGNLVCVEGIVTKCSVSKLKIVKSVHFCPATGRLLEKKYTDVTSVKSIPSSTVYPKKDEKGNLLETEFGLSSYKDHQVVTIQEMPEKSPVGQLPRSVDIICDNDLVDMCKPGDRVQIIGWFRCLPGKQGGYTTGIFRTVVVANSIHHLTPTPESTVSREDMDRIRAFVKQPNIIDILTRSLAPSIHGHYYVKKAILCLLIGGNEKILENGTRLRGDINVLLMGDPSVAKSQMLRYVLEVAPRAISTTGRGSTGVGLTAAVTADAETGERKLEAGAMVLADRGVVCIDEFDKMSDIDRTAIHEVMEQGKVTIAKAGVHARLNARCSVLAAANPVYGKYDQYKTPMENIGLQDSLLSRFDLLFVLLDVVDTEDDKRISDHVVRMHRYRNPKEKDGSVLPMDSSVEILSTRNTEEKDENDAESRFFEKYDPLLHGNSRTEDDQIVSIKFMKKYFMMCKTLTPPVLSEEASEIISHEYSHLRSQDLLDMNVAKTQPITARCLETLIRLATAHAKARFSDTVGADDARAAVDLVQYAVFRKVLDKKDKRKRPRNDNDDNTPAKTTVFSESEPEDAGAPESMKELRERTKRMREAASQSPTRLSEERLKSFKEEINRVFQEHREDSLSLAIVENYLKSCSNSFSTEEIKTGLEQLSDANNIMLAGDTVFLI